MFTMKIGGLVVLVCILSNALTPVEAAGGGRSPENGDDRDGEDDGGGKMPAGESCHGPRNAGDAEDGDDDSEEVVLPDSSAGVPVAAAMPCLNTAGYHRMLDGDVFPTWLEEGPDLNNNVPAPWELITEVDEDDRPALARPHTWQGRWSDFVDQYFPVLGAGGQHALMRFLILLCPKQQRELFFRYAFKLLLDKRASIIKKRGAKERSRVVWHRIERELSRAGLTPEQRENHRPRIELDLSGHWSREEQAKWDAGVDRAVSELAGDRMSGLSQLVSMSDQFVRRLTGKLSSCTTSAFRDDEGNPIPNQRRSSARKPRGTQNECDGAGRGDGQMNETDEDDGENSRKRRRTGRENGKKDGPSQESPDDDSDVGM